MNVISLFDQTGNMVEPWLQAGYTCWIVDIQHPVSSGSQLGKLKKINADLSQPWIPPVPKESIAFIAAFPPCTHLAVSGARWFKGKGLRDLSQAITLFATAAECCEWSGAPYLIENPVSTISTYWRKPDYTFNPCDYTGYNPLDNYTKKTCLWTGNGFRMPEVFIDFSLGPSDDRIHKYPPSKNRADLRSATPKGFARAVFEANKQRAPLIEWDEVILPEEVVV